MVAPDGTLVPLQLFTGYEDSSGYVWRKPDGVPGPAADRPASTPAAVYARGAGAGRVLGVAGREVLAGPRRLGDRRRGRALPGRRRCSARSCSGPRWCSRSRWPRSRRPGVEHYGFQSVGDLAVLAARPSRGCCSWCWPSAGCRSAARPTGPAARRWRWNAGEPRGRPRAGGVHGGRSSDRFWFHADRPHRALFFVRAVDLRTGLSPLTPLFLMCVAVTAGAYFQMERHELARRCRVPSPFPSEAEGRCSTASPTRTGG